MKFHLQGMGLVGSLTARLLDMHGVDFTWHDTDAPWSAWPASTGCVFPTGDEFDFACMSKWRGLVDDLALRDYYEEARWCYTSKNAPHNGQRYGVGESAMVGPITVSNKMSFHFDVQSIVRDTRELYAKRRKDPHKMRKLIVTHGTASAVRYTWGWSGRVKLEMPDELRKVALHRTCLYMRKVYDVLYLYPIPGSPRLYYGGTATISEKTPRERDVRAQYVPWKARVEERSGGLVTVVGLQKGSLQQGWRPVAAEGAPLVRRTSKAWYLKPMGGNGVRHFPALGERLMEIIQ